MPKVYVSTETARALFNKGLVDVDTGEVHMVKKKHKGVPTCNVNTKHIRVAKGVAKAKESGWAISLLMDAKDGVIKPINRTQRWRINQLLIKGFADRVGRGRYVLDPELWSDGTLPITLLPSKFNKYAHTKDKTQDSGYGTYGGAKTDTGS